MPTDVWKALADPTRRAILDELKAAPRTTGDLCQAFQSLDRCTVMKHLDVLSDAGLVVSERDGRRRLNYLNPAPLQEIVERWVSGHTAAMASAALKLRRLVEEKNANS
jgi:DNA-binding transcriptional ArsR family regulator